MGSLKEIGDFLKDAKGTIQELKFKADDIKGQSIARKSSAATLQFPVIVSRSINVDTASSVVKAVERQYAIFVQMVISLNPVIDWKEDDIPSFINRIHQNNPTPIDVIESCINVYNDETLGLRMITSINEGCNGQVLQSNKDQLFNIEEHLNQVKLNDLYKPEQITLEMANASLDYFMIQEASNRKNNKNKKTVFHTGNTTTGGTNGYTNRIDPTTGKIKDPKNEQELNYNLNVDRRNDTNEQNMQKELNRIEDNQYKEKQDKIKNKLEQDKFDEQKNQNKIKNKLERDKFEEEKKYRSERDKQQDAMARAKMKMEIDKANAEYRSKAVVKLADNDIKKCNELVPTTLSVTLQQMKGDNFGGNVNFVLGIKGLMHPVNSDEMVSNLLDGYKSGNKFFNFLRWTSGEISFLKDLLFNVDEIKEDVIRKHSKGSHWWTTLKRNRTLARMKNVIGNGKNRILPNATIACSMEEIMEIKDTYNVDLMEPKNAARLMDRYFLLGLVIVDESQELCYFMFDGEREFQALSFKGLEKENNNKNEFKDIYKMINSGRL